MFKSFSWDLPHSRVGLNFKASIKEGFLKTPRKHLHFCDIQATPCAEEVLRTLCWDCCVILFESLWKPFLTFQCSLCFNLSQSWWILHTRLSFLAVRSNLLHWFWPVFTLYGRASLWGSWASPCFSATIDKIRPCDHKLLMSHPFYSPCGERPIDEVVNTKFKQQLICDVQSELILDSCV